MPKGTAVVDRDGSDVGSDVGVVDDVRLDPQGGQVTGFILRLGSRLRTFFGGGEVVEVTRSQIDRVDTDGVHLHLTKDELGRIRSSYTG